MGTRSLIFLSAKLLYFFLGLCDYWDKFHKMCCSSCGGECPSTANFCDQCGQQLNLSQVSNKAASWVDKEKLLKENFHRGFPYAAIVSLLEKRHGVRMHVRMLKRKLKNRPRKLRPVRCCFLSTFRLITCRSFISWILFIFETTGTIGTIRTIIIWKQVFTRVKPVKYKCVNYVKFKRPWKSTSISIFLNTKLRNMQDQIFSHKLLLKEPMMTFKEGTQHICPRSHLRTKSQDKNTTLT